MIIKYFFLILFIVLSLCICCFANADEAREPDVVTINNQLLVYEEVAEKIIANAKLNNLDVIRNDKTHTVEIHGYSDLLAKVIRSRNEAKKSGWVFIECEDGISGINLGVEINKEKDLIEDTLLCKKTLKPTAKNKLIEKTSVSN